MARRRFLALSVLGGLGLAAGSLSMPLAGADSTNFSTAGSGSFSVPAGVCSVNVVAQGAQGGSTDLTTVDGSSQPGGAGGQESGTLPVTPGERLGVTVGGQGTSINASSPVSNAAGGTNGGGSGGLSSAATGFNGGGAGGGGASDVRQAPGGTGCVPVCQITPPARPGSTTQDRVVVAGGGGGAGPTAGGVFSTAGGAGGGVSGGTPNGAGSTGGNGPSPGHGGQAGASGGAGGAGSVTGQAGQAGTAAGTGGNGGSPSPAVSSGGGGGGGGGLVGGGGGGAGGIGDGGGGGGGSNSAAPTVTGANSKAGVNPGGGNVNLNFTPSAPIACAVVASARLTG